MVGMLCLNIDRAARAPEAIAHGHGTDRHGVQFCVGRMRDVDDARGLPIVTRGDRQRKNAQQQKGTHG